MSSKRKYPDITKLSGLRWEKFKPETVREEVGKCSFCPSKLYDNQHFFEGYSPDTNDCGCGCPVVYACEDCAVKSGVQW